jgi:hypothetical protein
MTRFRFSLLSLAGGTADVAVACASLVNASALVSSLIWGATLLCLTFALLCAMLSTPARRGFWVGFAVVGWLYALFAYGPLSGLSNVTSLDPLFRQAAEAMPQAKQLQTATALPLPRTYVVDTGTSLLVSADASQGATSKAVDRALRYLSVQASSVKNSDFIDSFVRISHAFVALLLGIVGGISGHFIRRRTILATSATP